MVLIAGIDGSRSVLGDEVPLAQDWDYAAAMKTVAAKGHGKSGVVIHVGDSITYANPYGGWARYGKGHAEADSAALKWMHTGANDDTDGWHLAAVDLPGGHSATACGGIRIDETLDGSRAGFPSLAKMLDTYRPQIVVLMLGTNDASGGRPLAAYQKDMEAAVDLMLDRGIIPILSTIPPHIRARALAASYNEALRKVGRERHLPLIDFEKEILKRRPSDWDGTLLGRGDVHPTAAQGGADQASEPTAENLKNSGYLLRGWLSVKKIEEVKAEVFDAATPPAKSSSATPAPENGGIRFPVLRDTFFSNVGDEGKGNNGGASQMKLKSIQEMSLVDIDPAPLKGRVIKRATLHLHLSSGQVLRRVTVGTFASDWVEGSGSGYAEQAGSSTFDFQRFPDVPWAFPGSDLTAVMLGQGGTIWHMAEASGPDEQRWQTIAVDPAVVAARVAGISRGFILSDDTGTEWTRDGEQFKLRHMPNRMVNTRESGEATAPFFMIEPGEKDESPPAAPSGVESDGVDFPAGKARVSWLTPADEGPAGTIGFLVEADEKPVPRYLIPASGKPGDRVTMILRDLGFAPGASVNLSIRAVDGAGNVGPAASISIKASERADEPLPGKAPETFVTNGPLPKIGAAEVAIVDALDKVEPLTGKMVPAQADEYLLANHLCARGRNRFGCRVGKMSLCRFKLSFVGR